MICNMRNASSFLKRKMFIILLFFCFATAYTQDSTRTDLNSNAINIYIDSPDWYMDLDYYRTEIQFVNYMRDRADADVHILTTVQHTGGDGREFTINFIGRGKFEGQQNTLKYISVQTDTEDIIILIFAASKFEFLKVRPKNKGTIYFFMLTHS
ncbi:hypothetical protein JW935_24220 [candidate division KSB1 bacterium]|nr:hypothetical protein [candidate division KSB1 bacterium]